MTKFLNISTDTTLGGNSASDEVVSSQKALKTYIDNHSGGGSANIDNLSITKNGDDELQTVGVIDQASSSRAIKTWTGLTANVPASPDANTIYDITDDNVNYLQNLLETLYPVGCLYFGSSPVCPMSAVLGTWTLVGTKIITDIANTAPCLGNGKGLGLTDGTKTFSIRSDNVSPYPIQGIETIYGENVGTSVTGGNFNNTSKVNGITTDSSKSGIIADTSSLSSSLTINIWQRSA